MHLSSNSHVVNPEKLYFECIFPLKLYLENSGKTDVKVLRRNPPDFGVTSGQKPCTKIIYIVLQTSVGLFSLSSQNNSFLATPNVENEC